MELVFLKPETMDSPQYPLAVKMLNKYLEERFNSKFLDMDLVKWINSPILDSLIQDNSFSGICKTKNPQLIKWFATNFVVEQHEYNKYFRKFVVGQDMKWFLPIFPMTDVHYWDERPFCEICGDGDIEMAEWFLKKYPETDVHIRGESPFEWACRMDRFEFVDWFLKRYPETDVWKYKENTFDPPYSKKMEERLREAYDNYYDEMFRQTVWPFGNLEN